MGSAAKCPESSFWDERGVRRQGFAVDPSYMPWGHTNPTYSARDDIGKALGKHTLQFGAQYVYSQRNQDNTRLARLRETHRPVDLQQSGAQHGKRFADFLVEKARLGRESPGFIQSFTQDSAKHRYYQRYQIRGPYFEDDWKVMHNLTVNLVCASVCLAPTARKTATHGTGKRRDLIRRDFAVDPVYGELLDGNAGSTPVPFNPSRFRSTLAW